MTTYKVLCLITLTLFVSGAAVGCKRKEQPKPGPEDIARITTKLASADAFDGKEDKTVTKCAGCKLGMDGDASHKIEAHGYALHFCADACKKHFAKELDKSLLAMEIPSE